MNHCLPRRIVIYRDGTGDGDIIMVRQYEVEALSAAFASFDSTYKPCFTVIVCQKRIHTRIFGRRVSMRLKHFLGQQHCGRARVGGCWLHRHCFVITMLASRPLLC